MTTEAQTIAELTAQGAEVKFLDGRPFVALPKDYNVHDLEKYLIEPTRKRGSVDLNDAASFVTYVNRYKNDQTVIFARPGKNPQFTAVFNEKGWADHRAGFPCPLSVEWLNWTGSDKKPMAQAAFAEFIENNLPDIVEPTAAEMLEISRSLQAKKKANFSSAIRLSNGENEFTYEEEISGTAAKGKLKVPEEFVIGVPVLEGGARYAVTCRLRYRISEGGLALWYEIVRPHKIMEDCVKDVTKFIQEGTEVLILNGAV